MCKLVFIFSFKVNQYVHMSGFVFGLFTAVIFLPYITFNHWYTKARVILTCLAGAVLLVMIIFMLIAFYKLQPHVPDYLSYVNCIPFTKLLCPAKSPWARGYIHAILPCYRSGWAVWHSCCWHYSHQQWNEMMLITLWTHIISSKYYLGRICFDIISMW